MGIWYFKAFLVLFMNNFKEKESYQFFYEKHQRCVKYNYWIFCLDIYWTMLIPEEFDSRKEDPTVFMIRFPKSIQELIASKSGPNEFSSSSDSDEEVKDDELKDQQKDLEMHLLVIDSQKKHYGIILCGTFFHATLCELPWYTEIFKHNEKKNSPDLINNDPLQKTYKKFTTDTHLMYKAADLSQWLYVHEIGYIDIDEDPDLQDFYENAISKDKTVRKN